MGELLLVTPLPNEIRKYVFWQEAVLKNYHDTPAFKQKHSPNKADELCRLFFNSILEFRVRARELMTEFRSKDVQGVIIKRQ